MRRRLPDTGARGVMTVRSLIEAGITRDAVMRGIARGELIRVRRGWVSTPEADPMLVAAARAGVMVSCITQAQRLGLWVIDDGRTHVAARPHAGRVHVQAHVHWERPVVPREPALLEDPIENVLGIVARCQPRDAALAVWNSALRAGLVDLQLLRSLPLPLRARELLDEATPFADSGLESIVVPRLRWLQLPLRRQVWILGHRVDLLIGDRLVLQIDGGHHVGPQRSEDIDHDARLMLRGYHVIRVGYEQVMNHWPQVQELIMRAVAQGLHRAS
ncbi:type IV toxin-antitoxin system AbiEi family antitoxin domain-containing protein [Microbacterium sp. Se5.02b]|nr:type IV toxin-antitoxin system AbiEi family antitoxin domain-containing protein [Microbacterium sp. Se5.02b]